MLRDTLSPSRRTLISTRSILGLALALIPTVAPADIPSDIATLTVAPERVRLNGMNRRQHVIVTARTKSGRSIDVTRDAVIESLDSETAVTNGAVVLGHEDGQTELRVSLGGQEVHVPVHVSSFNSFPQVHFVNDVVPVLSKLGCNSGGCHGKQSGQNGFKLSVFGFDPRTDFGALTKESRGRRTFPGDPERSLLITKAIGASAHGGGRRTTPGSADHELLSQWILQGMPWGDDAAAKVTSIEVEPADRVVNRQADQQLLVTAAYSNGSKRDVTSAAAYSSNAVIVADVDQGGLVQTGNVPGEAAITINYMGQVAVAKILIPRPEQIDIWPDLPEHNHIDSLVWMKLKRMGIVPSALADDATFLRRASLDATGTLPTPEEVRRFLADQRKDKRQRLIDDLLQRDEFADYWALKWADVMMVDRESLGERGAFELHRWLRNQMADNRPYDEWVRELLTATGISGKFGPVNFYRAMRTPDDLTRGVSQAFLGIRLDCAQCHHHPFEKWGQEDFYGLAGFFNGIERKPLANGRELVFHAGYKQTTMPLTKIPVVTKAPDGDPIDTAAADPRVQLADWMTRPGNPWFARLVANRLWSNFLGRGLVEPVDDLRSTNPATNEPLLGFLTEQVVETGYDLKAVMRLIMNSRVYQLSSVPNKTNARDEQNFSHYMVKRMPAEVLLDAICQVTDVPENFPGMKRGTRAIQVWDNRFPSYFLDTFGRSQRKSPCECGKSDDPTMSQALHLMNAPEIEQKLAADSGRVMRLAAGDTSHDQILEEITLAAWGRLPNDRERNVARSLFKKSGRRQAVEDIMWAVLNGYDFLFIR